MNELKTIVAAARLWMEDFSESCSGRERWFRSSLKRVQYFLKMMEPIKSHYIPLNPIKSPLNHHSITIQSPFNHHSITINICTYDSLACGPSIGGLIPLFCQSFKHPTWSEKECSKFRLNAKSWG